MPQCNGLQISSSLICELLLLSDECAVLLNGHENSHEPQKNNVWVGILRFSSLSAFFFWEANRRRREYSQLFNNWIRKKTCFMKVLLGIMLQLFGAGSSKDRQILCVLYVYKNIPQRTRKQKETRIWKLLMCVF